MQKRNGQPSGQKPGPLQATVKTSSRPRAPGKPPGGEAAASRLGGGGPTAAAPSAPRLAEGPRVHGGVGEGAAGEGERVCPGEECC